MKSNERIIWDYFMDETRIGNPYGVAGLMGNIKAESSFNPRNLNNIANRKLGMTDDQYTQAVDDGSYDNFINDGYDYGLCQWVFHTRKQKLLAMAKEQKKSIGDLQLQLDYIWKELQLYSAVLKVLKFCSSVKEASDIVLTKYEKPADQSEKVKERRLEFANDIFARSTAISETKERGETDMSEVMPLPEKIIVTGGTVKIRLGDSTDYADIGHVKKGSIYEVVTQSPVTGWYAIRVPKYVVWISPKYVEAVKENVPTEQK